MISKNRNYSELKRLQTFKERFDYLQLKGNVGESTFGFDRYLNQLLYKSRKWKDARDLVIIRDEGCDLGIVDYPIRGMVVIHHMNPISEDDIVSGNEDIYNPDFLICVETMTHRAIHFGDESLLPKAPIIRRPNDTAPWR